MSRGAVPGMCFLGGTWLTRCAWLFCVCRWILGWLTWDLGVDVTNPHVGEAGLSVFV